MSKPKRQPAAVDWRITLRRGMVHAGRWKVKVFTSTTAFDGYVGALLVLFTSLFVARRQDAT